MPTVQTLPAIDPGLTISVAQPFLQGEDYLQQIERSIALLAGQHSLRISLFRLEFVGIAAHELGARARQSLAGLGLIGALPDGSLGLLYMGARPSGQEDLSVERVIAEKVNLTLAQAAPSSARLLSVTAAHRWADEIADAEELIDEALFIVKTRGYQMRRVS